MKIRNGFVSNSSSSSFVVNTKFLNPWQLESIRDYYFVGLKLGMDLPKITEEDAKNFNIVDYFTDNITEENRNMMNNISCYINWSFEITSDSDGNEYLEGQSTMDNFNMYEFFTKIGIDNSIVEWRD